MEVKGEKLEIGYDGRIVVREMDITVKKGEITTIIGPNGSGKIYSAESADTIAAL